MSALEETPVVTVFLRHRGEVLLLRRSGEVGSYRHRWGAVAGHAEGEPDAAARWEIEEETGLGDDAVTFVRSGEPFAVDDEELVKRWRVHPYLFDAASRDVEVSWETTEAEWVAPPEILRRDTVPRLWTSYARVAPDVAAVRGDREHGSAHISLRALEVLRDRAGWWAWRLEETRGQPGGGEGERGEDGGGGALPPRPGASAAGREESEAGGGMGWSAEAAGAAVGDLHALARELLDARPSMAALANRVHRAMHACRGEPAAGYPAALERAAHGGLGRALDADAAAAARAASRVAGRTVLTLSRSGTVSRALLAADPPPRVLVAVSAPQGEGVGVAERLASAGLDVTLLADAAVGFALAGRSAGAADAPAVDLVVLGADTVLANGTVVNKTGSLPAALAARRGGVPVIAVAASDKVAPEGGFRGEEGDPDDLYAPGGGGEDGDPPFRRRVPLFEPVPADLLAGVITESATLAPTQVVELARELAALREW